MSPYISAGLGVVYVIPHVPARLGIEWERGFVDIGANVLLMEDVWEPPLPEIRYGHQF